MEHYICTGGCKGESPVAKVCEADVCAKKGEEMQLCGCEDGKHFGEFDFKDHNHEASLPVEE